MTWWAVVAVVWSAATAALLLCLVPHLAEPADELGGWIKPAYATIVNPPLVIATLALAMGTAALVSVQVPLGQLAMWLVLAGAVIVPVAVDARTTYLPARLMRLCWILLAVAVAASLITTTQGRLAMAVRMLGCAAAAATVLWLFWRFTRGLGYGDIGLVALLSVPTAASSVRLWFTALLAGTVAGALGGLLVSLWRRRRPSALGSAYAYGPYLWLGPWLALWLAPPG